MSKKKEKVRVKSNYEVLASIRKSWQVNPATRVEDHGKVYCRRKLKKQLKKDYPDYPRVLIHRLRIVG